MNELVKRKENLPETIDELVEFLRFGHEQLNLYREKLKSSDRLDLFQSKQHRDDVLEHGQQMGIALLYAEEKLGSMISRIPPQEHGDSGKFDTKLPEGITYKQSHYFQEMSRNPEVVEQVIVEAIEMDNIPTRSEALKKIREKVKDDRIKQENEDRKKKVSGIEIRKGDFKVVLDDVYNIDAIITDPPYPFEFIDCFSELGLYAKNHLKKDGFIVVYSGQYHLPEVIKRLSEHLTYVWTFCLSHSNKTQIVNGVNIMCGWKPVLIFSNGRKKMRFPSPDVIISGQREKSSHEWQQSESGVYPLIELFTKPGELVVDPFSGSGTFGKVATENGRKFIGAEIK